MPPGAGSAALVFIIPFALACHALCISGLRAALPKKPKRRERHVEERRHESEMEEL
jgi:hypothetical protein